MVNYHNTRAVIKVSCSSTFHNACGAGDHEVSWSEFTISLPSLQTLSLFLSVFLGRCSLCERETEALRLSHLFMLLKRKIRGVWKGALQKAITCSSLSRHSLPSEHQPSVSGPQTVNPHVMDEDKQEVSCSQKYFKDCCIKNLKHETWNSVILFRSECWIDLVF